MMRSPSTGSRVAAATLEQLGISHVFGVPGSQTISLCDALRERPGIDFVLSSHELGAAFMANGYFRASGNPAAVLTIPGAGFTYAVTGLAEAKLDSVALLHIVGTSQAPGGEHPTTSIDQVMIAEPLVKRVVEIREGIEITPSLASAYRSAVGEEPGPVLVQITAAALRAEVPVGETSSPDDAAAPLPSEATLVQIRELLDAAEKPLLFVGQGAAGAAQEIRMLVERHGAAVLTTTSGRGALPEDHPLALQFDFLYGDMDELNSMVASCDFILALGCKFSHNGTGGFALALPEDRLVNVNADAEALESGYPAAITLRASAETVVGSLLGQNREAPSRDDAGRGWHPDAIAQWRQRFEQSIMVTAEPRVQGTAESTAESFFHALREALPRDGIMVTDSGLHQYLARRYFKVLTPRGFIAPSNFQAMGFGIPAAIGAKLAAPQRPVVALVGDGGFMMAGMETLTAVRERLPLTIVVFNDGQLNLIRLQQLEAYGRGSAVGLANPDFEVFAEAIGARYVSFERDGRDALAESIRSPHVTIVEVRLRDSAAIHSARLKGNARRLLGGKTLRRLKRLLLRR